MRQNAKVPTAIATIVVTEKDALGAELALLAEAGTLMYPYVSTTAMSVAGAGDSRLHWSRTERLNAYHPGWSGPMTATQVSAGAPAGISEDTVSGTRRGSDGVRMSNGVADHRRAVIMRSVSTASVMSQRVMRCTGIMGTISASDREAKKADLMAGSAGECRRTSVTASDDAFDAAAAAAPPASSHADRTASIRTCIRLVDPMASPEI